MSNNPRSFFSTNTFHYEKCPNLTDKINFCEREMIIDNCEGMVNSSKNTLDYYWSYYFEKYGTSLQENFRNNDEITMPYHEYLRKSIKSIISNTFYGLVKTVSFKEEEHWNIITSVLPTSILNCLRYTPHRMENNEVAIEFIIYQIISMVEELHTSNIPLLNLSLDNIYMDENFVIKLSLPNLNSLSEKADLSFKNREHSTQTTNNSECLDSVLWQWMFGTISNLDYLLYLNKLAGRTESDPNNHIMIPWVTDFTEPFGGLRDLKLSKFRINKGDDHLDKIYQDQQEEFDQFESNCPLTFQMNSHTGYTIDTSGKVMLSAKARSNKGKISVNEYTNPSYECQPSQPHHVSDILSELSYYAYMARVTPIDILKKSYRSFYNPEEFRWNMKKMYDWTPDECIPQFFTEPSVFRSVHPDMPDIELPDWCQSPEEFVVYHREVLESPAVSVELHHWIDLVFGNKLIGEQAILFKNVHRQFADRSSNITNNGSTVLFRTPHPKRLCCLESLKKFFGSRRPEFSYDKSHSQSNESVISLPDDYNPTELIDYYKDFNVFIQNSCVQEAVELRPISKACKPLLDEAFEEDIISVCCLIIELFNYDKLRADYLFMSKNLKLRVKSCYLLFIEDSGRIPVKFRDSLEKIISSAYETSGRIPNIFELRRSERWFVFNKTLIKLYEMVKNISSPSADKLIAVKHFFHNPLDSSKLNLKFFNLITPHFVHLLNTDDNANFENVLEILVCIIERYGLITGKPYFSKEFLPHIINLYPTLKSLVKSHHALLYQRTFLNLLLIRIGMMEFLNNITELLVQMLVIGQQVFASMKESSNVDMDFKNVSNDSESLNEYETSSIWYAQNGDDETTNQDNRISQISMTSEGEGNTGPEPDSVSQNSIDNEDSKTAVSPYNGYLLPNTRNILDNLPLSDNEMNDDISQCKSKNVGFAQLLVSPFRKPSITRQKSPKSQSTRIQVRQNLSHDCSKMSLAKLSCSSLIWLADLIGPIQASSRILCELLAQYLSCYQNFNFDEILIDSIDQSLSSFVTGTYDSCIQADLETAAIFDCLREFIALYGLSVVEYQFRHFLSTLLDNTKFLTDNFGEDRERNLVCSVSLLRFLGMVIPDIYLEPFLSEKILDNYLPLIIKCIGNMTHPFPSGVRARKVLFHKTIDLVYLLSSRMKYDQIQLSMGNILKLLFELFSKTFVLNMDANVVYRQVPLDWITSDTDNEASKYLVNFISDANDFSIQSDQSKSISTSIPSPLISERHLAFEEMKNVITTELANVLYITFAKLLGQNRLNNLLCNNTLIQALVLQHENDTSKSNNYSSPDKVKQQKLEESLQYFTSSIMNHRRRHLSDCWKQYWIHELGLSDSEPFDIKQMCLGKFDGHNNSVKGFDVLNCENGFLSYGKDRVVKLFSCADVDYNNVSNDIVARFNYSHQKPVTDAMFIEQLRLAVSVDGLLHLWDPFVGKKIHVSSLGVSIPNWSIMCQVPPSNFQVVVGNADGRLQIVDLRSCIATYSFNLNLHNANTSVHGDFATSMGIPGGVIKEISVSPDGNQLIMGNSEGFISIVELRMSKLLQNFRPHQNEISQIKFMKNWCITSSAEPNGKLYLFSLSNFSRNHSVYGYDLGSIHSIMILRNQVLVGASQNRFGLFTNLYQYKSLSRLSSTLYKGYVTTASLLLHNRLLLLGSDTGNISLWY